MREVFDGLELLLGVFAARCKNLSHFAWILSDGLGDSIDGAKLRWDMAVLTIDLNDEERLLQVSDFEVVVLREVLSDAQLVAVVSLEAHSDWGLGEIYILDEVSFLMAIGTNDGLELEFMEYLCLLITNIVGVVDLMDSLQASLVRDELVDIVNHNSQT